VLPSVEASGTACMNCGAWRCTMVLDEGTVAGCWRLNNVGWSLWIVVALRGGRGGTTGGKLDVADDCVRCISLGRIAGGRGGAAEKDWEQVGLGRLTAGLGGTCGSLGGNSGNTRSSSDRLTSEASSAANADSSAGITLHATLTSVSSTTDVSAGLSLSLSDFSTSATTVNVCKTQNHQTALSQHTLREQHTGHEHDVINFYLTWWKGQLNLVHEPNTKNKGEK